MSSCNQKQMILNYFGDNLEKGLKSMIQGGKDAQKKFLKKYPRADMTKFGIFVDLNKDGTISSTEVVCTTNGNSHGIISDRTQYTSENGEAPIRVAMDRKNCMHCTRCECLEDK